MKIRKAILTGGGRATRLHPVTTTTNKHLIPLANKPMMYHAIEKVVEAGVKEIFINTNPGDTTLEEYIGDGSHWGVKIMYFEQTGGPQGIAHVVNEAKPFIGNDPFLFYLSDNILLGSVKEMVEEFSEKGYDCMLALSKVKDPQRFGVPVFDESGALTHVEEKPLNPKSEFAVTGMYLYGPKLFFEAFDHIEKSERGEYEISDIHSHLLKSGKNVGYKEITGWWKDTGKSEDLHLANKLLLDQMKSEEFENNGRIDEGATLTGAVHIGIGTVVGKGVTITGPVVIGENCILEDCSVGPYVTIGGGAEIRSGAQLSHDIILEHASIVGPIHVTESLLGRHVHILAKDGEQKTLSHMRLGDKTEMTLS